MKKRKNLGCLIKGTKERGAWAELYFMVMAMSQGLKVSSPYGGLGPYDVGVENGGPILRVQVKCTLYQCSKGCYCMSVNVKDGSRGRRGYARGTVDFFAIYIIPTDDWYILPYEVVVGDRDANLFFRPGVKGQKYDEYREAWDLLLRAADSPPSGPLEIHACCDEGDAASDGRVARRAGAVRKMFQQVFQG